MSKYTVEVRYICESLANEFVNVGEQNVDNIIDNSWNKIFDNFPIYDEQHRKDLCCKILKHYYTREIGEETYGLWKLRINTTMQEIMPYYNELYKSADLSYNPLHDKDITIEYNDESNSSGTLVGNDKSKGTNSGTSSAEDSSMNKYLDTPQNGVADLQNNRYLTNAREIKGNGITSGSNEFENENEQTQTNTSERQNKGKQIIKGKNGGSSYAKMIEEYRSVIINVDMQIIDKLSDCFINIY